MSHPDLRFEHALRYRAAAPIVAASDVWCDLGCGAGLAAAAALERFPGRLVLVDRDADALAEAAARVPAGETREVVADLSDENDLARVREAVLPATAGAITCFEVVERLDRFAPVLELIVELVENSAFTAVLSIPNDAFSSVEDSSPASIWGESPVRELQTLLESDHVVASQLALAGSWITREPGAVTVSADLPADRVPTHFIVALGPRSGDLGSASSIAVADLDERRHWERRRDADLEYYRALAERRPS